MRSLNGTFELKMVIAGDIEKRQAFLKSFRSINRSLPLKTAALIGADFSAIELTNNQGDLLNVTAQTWTMTDHTLADLKRNNPILYNADIVLYFDRMDDNNDSTFQKLQQESSTDVAFIRVKKSDLKEQVNISFHYKMLNGTVVNQGDHDVVKSDCTQHVKNAIAVCAYNEMRQRSVEPQQTQVTQNYSKSSEKKVETKSALQRFVDEIVDPLIVKFKNFLASLAYRSEKSHVRNNHGSTLFSQKSQRHSLDTENSDVEMLLPIK